MRLIFSELAAILNEVLLNPVQSKSTCRGKLKHGREVIALDRLNIVWWRMPMGQMPCFTKICKMLLIIEKTFLQNELETFQDDQETKKWSAGKIKLKK